MEKFLILIILAAGFAVDPSVALPDCLNCEICVKAVPIRAGGCSLPAVFNGNLDTCLPDETPAPCPGSDLQVYNMFSKTFLLNPSVVEDLSTSRFIIKEDGGVAQAAVFAIINKTKKTVIFYDSLTGYIANPYVDENGKAVGAAGPTFPSDMLGIYTVTAQAGLIPA